MIGRLMLDKALGPRADVLAPLAAQKKDVEVGNLEWPEREIVLVPLPHMVHELAHRGSIGRAAKIHAAGGADDT